MALTKLSTDGVKDDAITSGKIPANAVGTSEIANNAVTSTQIADNTIVDGDIADATITLAKLEHGTGSNDGKFLRANNGADPSFETVTSTTINSNTNNQVITATGTANTLQGESALTFDGSHLILGSGKGIKTNYIRHADGSNTNTGAASQQYWKIGEIGLNGSEGAVITLVGANGYSSGSTAAGETTIVLRGSNGSTLLGFWYSDAAGDSATYSDVRWKHISGVNYELWVSAGSYNNVAPVIVKTTGTFDNTNAAGTNSNNAPSGSTALASSHRKKVGTIDTIEYQSTGTIFKRNVVMANGYGIDFSSNTENESGAGASTAQLLDDYEEGTWTPVFDAPNQSSTTFGLNHQYGYYTKIGNLVHVTCYLQGFAASNEGGGANDDLAILGLPFTVANLPGGGQNRHAASFAVGSRYRMLVDDLILNAFGGGTEVRLFEHTSGNTMVRVKTNQITARGGTNECYFAGSYRIHA